MNNSTNNQASRNDNTSNTNNDAISQIFNIILPEKRTSQAKNHRSDTSSNDHDNAITNIFSGSENIGKAVEKIKNSNVSKNVSNFISKLYESPSTTESDEVEKKADVSHPIINLNRYCTSCGYALGPNLKFCPNCGVKLDNQSQSVNNTQEITYKNSNIPVENSKSIDIPKNSVILPTDQQSKTENDLSLEQLFKLIWPEQKTSCYNDTSDDGEIIDNYSIEGLFRIIWPEKSTSLVLDSGRESDVENTTPAPVPKFEVSEVVLLQEQEKAKFWNTNLNLQLFTLAVIIMIVSMISLYLSYYFSSGGAANDLAKILNTAINTFFANDVELDFTDKEHLLASLDAYKTQGWQDVVAYFTHLKDRAIFYSQIITSAPFVLYSTITLWAFTISIGASRIFKNLSLSHHKIMVDRTTLISFIGIIGGAGGVIAICHPISLYWNSLLMFISLNLIVLSGNWLTLRFFSVKGALSTVSSGNVPSKPWSWHVWLSNICVVTCLLMIDSIILPIYYYLY
ncbi:hypothetical protein [Succinimonas sp.]|uniref:zinc ribbon domain-containing protein n=1 Tax=Succinimonas sp. TaxID=1936151 RepID=UPI00386BAAA9